MKQVQDFQKMSKEHFAEQADSFVDFYFQGQEQVCNMVDSVVDNSGKKQEDAEPVQAEDENDGQADQ